MIAHSWINFQLWWKRVLELKYIKPLAPILYNYLPLSFYSHSQMAFWILFLLAALWPYPQKVVYTKIQVGKLEKAMAPHSSTLAWKIPWTEEPGRLQFMVSLRVGHYWATSLSLFSFIHWRRKWQPTPVFLPRESEEWWSLVGCRLWGRTELDTTEVT